MVHSYYVYEYSSSKLLSHEAVSKLRTAVAAFSTYENGVQQYVDEGSVGA